MTVGERLQKALDHWGRGVMAFRDEMKDRLKGTDVQGYTHPAIKRYLDDSAEPSLKFLEEAALALGVRYSWLATEQGDMTKDLEEVRVVAATMTASIRVGDIFKISGDPDQPPPPPMPLLDPVLQPVLETLQLPTPDGTPSWASGLVEVWRQLARSGEGGPETDAQCIAEAIRAPLDAFGVDPVEMQEGDRLHQYLFTMVPALLAVVAERQRQAPKPPKKGRNGGGQ